MSDTDRCDPPPVDDDEVLRLAREHATTTTEQIRDAAYAARVKRDRVPIPHDDTEPTPRGGRAPVTPPSVVLGPEAMSDLLVRLTLGFEEFRREMVGALEAHQKALTELTNEIVELRGSPPHPRCPLKGPLRLVAWDVDEATLRRGASG